MRKELDTVIGRDRLPALSDRLHLPYTEAFLCESQRLGDLVQFSLPHASVEDTILCGHRIPAGTNVMINLNSIHSDSEIYPEVGYDWHIHVLVGYTKYMFFFIK